MDGFAELIERKRQGSLKIYLGYAAGVGKTYAMLQEGKAYEAHAHGDHEEVYYIISGIGEMTVNGETRAIRDGDAVFIPAGFTHSIANRGQEFLVFLAFSSQVPDRAAGAEGI